MVIMKKILTILAVVVTVIILGVFAVDWPDPSITIDGIKVQGPEEFRQDIVEGLDLLREKAPEHYAMVVGNIRKVYLSEDDFNGWRVDKTFSFSQEAYNAINEYGEHKVYQMALSLVHEADHAQRQNEDEWTYDIPTEEWLAVETEKEVAKLIDAPQEIKDWLETIYETRWWEEEKP
jgi:hypothetical protein